MRQVERRIWTFVGVVMLLLQELTESEEDNEGSTTKQHVLSVLPVSEEGSDSLNHPDVFTLFWTRSQHLVCVCRYFSVLPSFWHGSWHTARHTSRSLLRWSAMRCL